MTAILQSMEHLIGRELGKVLWGALVVTIAATGVVRKIRNQRRKNR